MTELAKLLRELRGKRPLRIIAEESGLSIPYISDLEHARTANPSIDKLRRLASVYRYPLSELMAAAGASDEEIEQAMKDDHVRVLSEFEREILTKLADLGPDAQELVRASVNRIVETEKKRK